MTETAKLGSPKNKKNAPAGESGNQAEIRRTGADRQMRKDTERVLTVLLALALALLAITAFALARAQQRIRLNEVPNGTHETVSVAMCVSNPDRSPVGINR